MFRFRAVLSIVPVIVGLAFLVGLPAKSSAYVTCGWCEEWYRITIRGGVIVSEGYLHKFFDSAGDQCLWPRPVPDVGSITCNRCGGTSYCHTDAQSGPCHMACGGTGDLAEAVGDIRESLAVRDIKRVVSAILRERADLSVKYVPAAGRIDFVPSCDPRRVAHTIAVLPEVRGALDAEMAAGMAGAH